MRENKFTESMEVIETGTMRICNSVPICANFTDVTGVLLDGIAEDAEKLLHEKVEIVSEGTKAKLVELEASNKELLEALEGMLELRPDDCSSQIYKIRQKAEKAIQKARGIGDRR